MKKVPIISIVYCIDYFFYSWKITHYEEKEKWWRKTPPPTHTHTYTHIYTPVFLAALDLNSISWPPGHAYGVLTYDVWCSPNDKWAAAVLVDVHLSISMPTKPSPSLVWLYILPSPHYVCVNVFLPEERQVLLWSASYCLKNIGSPPWNSLPLPTCKLVLKGAEVAYRLIICFQLSALVWPECVCVALVLLLSGYQFFPL